MKIGFLIIVGAMMLEALVAQPSDRYKENETFTHSELIAEYQKLEDAFPEADLIEYGSTDVGRPLHLFVLNKAKVFDPLKIEDRAVLLIMNGIHPGESCGVDASLKWSYDLLSTNSLPDNVVICIIPIYNVGGALNRRPHTRANQNGPAVQGFRGNARNLDLNRDFIKADAQNTRSFYSIFNDWNPDVFIDTHTTDGADFPYDLTLIGGQPDALGPVLGPYMRQIFEPALYERMRDSNHEIVPYVNVFGSDPLNGWARFFESPRYSTGFAALHHCFPFVTEAHMLKSYQKRVEATYAFLDVMSSFMNENSRYLQDLRTRSIEMCGKSTKWPIAWELDSTKVTQIPFKGYEASQVPMVSVPGDKINFNHDKLIEKKVDFHEWYKAKSEGTVPKYYIVPQAWHEVVDRLLLNGVEMEKIPQDTALEVEVSYFSNIDHSKQPYEGHHVHSEALSPEIVREVAPFYQGDFLISTRQKARRFIIETLEATATDSYFRWGFFDSSLQQKEWYSGYIFDTTAARMLQEDAALRRDFEAAKEADPRFKESGQAQMYWLYQHSMMFEKPGRYPVAKMY